MKRLEELSNKLDIEIKKKQESERLESHIKSAAETAGIWGAVKGAIGGAFVGFIIGGIIGIWWNTFGVIIFFVSIIIGGIMGYNNAYERKRNWFKYH